MAITTKSVCGLLNNFHDFLLKLPHCISVEQMPEDTGLVMKSRFQSIDFTIKIFIAPGFNAIRVETRANVHVPEDERENTLLFLSKTNNDIHLGAICMTADGEIYTLLETMMDNADKKNLEKMICLTMSRLLIQSAPCEKDCNVRRMLFY